MYRAGTDTDLICSVPAKDVASGATVRCDTRRCMCDGRLQSAFLTDVALSRLSLQPTLRAIAGTAPNVAPQPPMKKRSLFPKSGLSFHSASLQSVAVQQPSPTSFTPPEQPGQPRSRRGASASGDPAGPAFSGGMSAGTAFGSGVGVGSVGSSGSPARDPPVSRGGASRRASAGASQKKDIFAVVEDALGIELGTGVSVRTVSHLGAAHLDEGVRRCCCCWRHGHLPRTSVIARYKSQTLPIPNRFCW